MSASKRARAPALIPQSEAEAAAIIIACRQVLAERGSDILREILGAAAVAVDWRHFPEGDFYDPHSHAQYFYHCHPASDRALGEHGHFHLFLRAEGMPSGIAPLVLPEIAVANAAIPPQAAPLKRGASDEVGHLVAIAIDAGGEPVRLFTTNRWVTGETWYRAEDVIRMIDRFAIVEGEPSAMLNLWLCAMLRLFRSQIGALLRARDDAVRAWRWRRRVHVFDDPRLEITSTVDIDLKARLAAAAQSGGAPARRARLPRMAEGWGG